MANTKNSRLYRVDTTGTIVAAGTTVPVCLIVWHSADTAADTLIVADANDNVLAELSIAVAGDTVSLELDAIPHQNRLLNGLKVTLDSGICLVYVG